MSPLDTKLHFCHQNTLAIDVAKALSHHHKIACIIDTAVAAYLPTLDAACKNHQIQLFPLVLTGGEHVKSLTHYEQILSFFSTRNLSKDDSILAIGGGTILDVTGFAAATYMRGIHFSSIPTTLLAMVDACIGGKTAINLFDRKNQVGALYPAKHLFFSSHFLDTLSRHAFQEGISEIIKYGLVLQKDIFDLLREQTSISLTTHPHLIQTLIAKSVSIKQNIVEKDFYSSGLRHVLNFGHTIAHALEGFYQYTISHGEAVAIGMCIEARLSCTFAGLSQKECHDIAQLIHQYELLQNKRHFSFSELAPFLLHDKKCKKNQPYYVCIQSIGQAASFHGVYCTPISPPYVEEAIHWYQELTL